MTTIAEFMELIEECGVEMRRPSLLPGTAPENVVTPLRHYHSAGKSAGSILDLMGSH